MPKSGSLGVVRGLTLCLAEAERNKSPAAGGGFTGGLSGVLLWETGPMSEVGPAEA